MGATYYKIIGAPRPFLILLTIGINKPDEIEYDHYEAGRPGGRIQ
jgi:hypothetical protein